MLHKYIGRTVDIIYMDRKGELSRRRIRVQTVDGDIVRAFDMVRKAPRVFRLDRILAIHPVTGSA